MSMNHFDINCDLGESIGNDADIMPYLDACSVACGGHIGDRQSMKATILLAKKQGVNVGAHPSFPDPKHFGRKVMNLSPEALYESIYNQVKSFQEVCEAEHLQMEHIKAHGALYNLAAVDEATAEVLIRVLKNFPGINLLAPWGSLLGEKAVKEAIPVKWEGFADRKYTKEGNLVSRLDSNAVITDPNKAIEQVLSVAREKHLIAITGEEITLKAQTFCVHGDNPAAVSIAKTLSQLKHANS